MPFGGAATVTERESAVEQILTRGFFTAYLLTRSARLAEDAVVEAIARWDPDREDEEALFRSILQSASRDETDNSIGGETAALPCPGELQRVLRLSPHLRRSYVLRVLVKASPSESARLLRLHARRVDECAYAALRLFAAYNAREESVTPAGLHQQIQNLAYRLWQERGSPLGSSDEDWFRAEAEIRRQGMDGTHGF